MNFNKARKKNKKVISKCNELTYQKKKKKKKIKKKKKKKKKKK